MTRARLAALLLSAASASACAAPSASPSAAAPTAPPPSPTAPPSAAPAPARQLRARGELLFVTAPPDTYKRGELLYVLDAQPLHGTTRLRIGLVQVTEPKPVRVAWYCRPTAPVDAALAGQGLPVEDFVPDTTVRVGKCWGRYAPPAAAGRSVGSVVDLALNLGEGDGLRPDDLFEVLGDPIPDEDNRTVIGFKPLGRCTILPFEGTPLTSVCRLDRAVSPEFDPSARPSGGFVRLLQEAARKP